MYGPLCLKYNAIEVTLADNIYRTDILGLTPVCFHLKNSFSLYIL